jgi:hypothetical protein
MLVDGMESHQHKLGKWGVESLSVAHLSNPAHILNDFWSSMITALDLKIEHDGSQLLQ